MELRLTYRRFPKEILPFPILQTAGKPDYPDFFNCCGYVAVSARFKTLLAEFEPAVHHFEPIILTDIDGVERAGELFVLRVGAEIDGGILLEESDMIERGMDGRISHYESTTLSPKIMWSAGKIHGKHLWVDSLAKGAVVVSDEFYAEMKRMNMTGFQAQESRAK